MGRRDLERALEALSGFEAPSARLEQYPTPADVAANLVHVADMQGDLGDRPVLDLGTGTGILAIGAVLCGSSTAVGIDLDKAALSIARNNARRANVKDDVSWLLGDARCPPFSDGGPSTVLMNPPFGAQDGAAGADRSFLETARSIGDVSYSIHNGGSRSFVESYVEDNGGEITHAFALDLDIDHQFSFHDRPRETIDAEAYRIEWPA